MELATAKDVAFIVGVNESTVRDWASTGRIPSVRVGSIRRYELTSVARAIIARRTTKRCSRCGKTLPNDHFRGHPRRGVRGRASDCNVCHKAHNQHLRRQKAEASGRSYRTRVEIIRDKENAKRMAEAIRAARKAARPAPLSREEIIRRSVARQRERYNSDPEYKARIKAKKIRRKRVFDGAFIEPVNHEVVARRDGWRCGICGKRVSRDDWSLDHIVPLSKGGEHSYRNVTLAHRSCNSARGAGRLPVQAPLLWRPAP